MFDDEDEPMSAAEQEAQMVELARDIFGDTAAEQLRAKLDAQGTKLDAQGTGDA